MHAHVSGQDRDHPAIGTFVIASDYVDAATATKGFIGNKDGNHGVCLETRERGKHKKKEVCLGFCVWLGFSFVLDTLKSPASSDTSGESIFGV
jgi:hypothetical protein